MIRYIKSLEVLNSIKLPIDSQLVVLLAASKEGRMIQFNNTDIYVEIEGKQIVLDRYHVWWDLHELGEIFNIPGELFVSDNIYRLNRIKLETSDGSVLFDPPIIPYRILFAFARQGYTRENIIEPFKFRYAGVNYATLNSIYKLRDFFENGRCDAVPLGAIMILLKKAGLSLADITLIKTGSNMSVAAVVEKTGPAANLFRNLSKRDTMFLLGAAKILMKRNTADIPEAVLFDALFKLYQRCKKYDGERLVCTYQEKKEQHVDGIDLIDPEEAYSMLNEARKAVRRKEEYDGSRLYTVINSQKEKRLARKKARFRSACTGS